MKSIMLVVVLLFGCKQTEREKEIGNPYMAVGTNVQAYDADFTIYAVDTIYAVEDCFIVIIDSTVTPVTTGILLDSIFVCNDLGVYRFNECTWVRNMRMSKPYIVYSLKSTYYIKIF